MSFETTATIASFGGKLLKLKHKSTSTNTDMELNVFMPPQAAKSGAKIPVLFYLSGLTAWHCCCLPGYLAKYVVASR
jgi:S-formylglutathione hydrolase